MKKFTKINELKSNPLWAKGELIIKFKDDVTGSIIPYILKKIGLKKSNIFEYSLHDDPNIVVVTIPNGEELEWMNKIKEIDDVEWVDRRDLKFEYRTHYGELVEGTIQDIYQRSDVDDPEWIKRIDEVISILNFMKEDRFEELEKLYPSRLSKLNNIK